MDSKTMSRPRAPIDWVNASFIGGTHLLAVLGTIGYLVWHGPTWAALILFLALSGVSIFSISAGYHRLFSHATYDAHPALRLFFLLFGAATFQNTALKWALDHRRHHKRVDTDRDPYNIKEGFWHAHVGWVLRKEDPNIQNPSGADLERDPLVMWQQRHYVAIATAVGFVLPLVLGWLAGDPWGGLIIGGVLRVVVVHHVTFAINSVAHYLGTQPYSDDNTSRDSFVTALLSMGEGYHNFHHTFPTDYRNGVQGHQFDPTKWILRGLSFTGVTKNLRRTPRRRILQAKMDMDQRRLEKHFGGGLPPKAKARIEVIRKLFEQRMDRFQALKARRDQLRASAEAQAKAMLASMHAEIRAARREVHHTVEMWKRAARPGSGLLTT